MATEDQAVSPPLPEAVREQIDTEAHRIADGIPSILKMSAEPRAVVIDYVAGALNNIAEAAAQQERARLEQALTCRNGGPHYCPNCDKTIRLPEGR